MSTYLAAWAILPKTYGSKTDPSTVCILIVEMVLHSMF